MHGCMYEWLGWTHQADEEEGEGGAEVEPGPAAGQHPDGAQVAWGPSIRPGLAGWPPQGHGL